MFSGTQFRSRLEARWAAFFDLAGWRWIYEPVDFSGWIPDFALIGQSHLVLIEVKPLCWINDNDHETMRRMIDRCNDLEKCWRVIDGAAKDDLEIDLNLQAMPEVLVVGAYPHIIDDEVLLGAFLREAWGNGCDLAILRQGYHPQRFDFHAHYGSYEYRIGGHHDGDHHIKALRSFDVEEAWRGAGNAVQWFAK
jgi:hypothetical protein